MPRNNGSDKKLYCQAAARSSLKIAEKPRVRPHPGQEIPHSLRNKQGMPVEKVAKAYRTAENANPTPRERRICFFLAGRCFKLYHGLPIAITEAAGADADQIVNGADQAKPAGEKV